MKTFFYIDRSKIYNRYDPSFYVRQSKLTDSISLYKVVDVLGGKRIPKGMNYTEKPTNYLYLRVADISDNYIDFTNLKHIDNKVYEILRRYEIFNNNIALSIAGTIGKVVYINNIPENTHIILTENCAKLVVKRHQEILPFYLKIVLELDVVQQQIQDNYIQTTIPKLSLERIKHLSIPLPPDLQKQQEIIDKYMYAYHVKQKKEQEATDLLNSIDDYLLSELGIDRVTDTRRENGRFFYTSFHNLMGSEWAPLCIKNNGRRSKSTLYKEVKLSTIATITKGQAITSKEIVSGSYPVIAGGQSSPYSHNQYNYKGNIITISASGAYSGYVWYHNYPIFASDCSVILSNDENVYLTKYIYEILRLRQQEIYLLQKGAGQPHVYPSDIANLTIPALPWEKQQEIVAYCQKLRNKTELLQKEGRDIISKAKETIEQMIIGN